MTLPSTVNNEALITHFLSPLSCRSLFPSWPGCDTPPSFLLAPGPRLIPTLSDIGVVKVSVLADWFLYLKPIPHAWLTHCPDDAGSKDL
jgi:hypothetical protein